MTARVHGREERAPPEPVLGRGLPASFRLTRPQEQKLSGSLCNPPPKDFPLTHRSGRVLCSERERPGPVGKVGFPTVAQ